MQAFKIVLLFISFIEAVNTCSIKNQLRFYYITLVPARRETLVFLDILLRQHEHKKAKLTVNFLAFPSVKFRKTRQIGSKYFTLVGARF